MKQDEIVIRNVTVIDGTGAPRFLADVITGKGKIQRLVPKKQNRGVEGSSQVGTLSRGNRNIHRTAKQVGKESEKPGCVLFRQNAYTVEIDGTGLVLSPGWIDDHGHSDVQLFHDSSVFNKAEQGITTELSGMCGVTMAPVEPVFFSQLRDYVEPFVGSARMPEDWQNITTFDQYLSRVETLKLGINMAFFVGHGTLRIAAMGLERHCPNSCEMDRMKGHLREAMESGAWGMSAGLVYSPGIYSKTAELVRLCEVVSEYDGVFSVHIRNESDEIESAVSEAIHIAKESGVRLVLSHHKIGGARNKGRSEKTLALVEAARAEGLCVFLDQYPYTSAASILGVTIPPRFLQGGMAGLLKQLKQPRDRREIAEAMEQTDPLWDSFIHSCGYDGITIVSCDGAPELVGHTVKELAEDYGTSGPEVIIDVLLKSEGRAGAVYRMTNEEDLEQIMKYPQTMMGTDGEIYTEQGLIHPRLFGTVPRILGRYVREKHILSLEEAVRKMTSLPAATAGFKKKGKVKEGFDADLTLFDPELVIDRATYEQPTRSNDGIIAVLINGGIAVKEGRQTSLRSGQVLRRKPQ